MSLGVAFTRGFDFVMTLRDNSAVNHLKLAWINYGRIGDCNDLLVCHPGYGVGKAVAIGCTRRAHRLTRTGFKRDAVWIQRESRTGNGIGHDNILAYSE